MHIATINIDWFKKSQSLKSQIIEELNANDFDFLVVSENINSFVFNPKFNSYHSKALPIDREFQHLHYGNYLKGETPIRVSIYSKHNSIQSIPVNDPYTSICHKFKINDFEFIVYGTIIGTYGIRYQSEIAKTELDNFISDIDRISKQYENIIILGDFNTSFITSENRQLAGINSRKVLAEFIDRTNFHVPTASLTDCIDHICISNSIFNSHTFSVSEFLENNNLKDHPHRGINLELKLKS